MTKETRCLAIACTANLSELQEQIIQDKWKIMLEQDEERIEENNRAVDKLLLRQTYKRYVKNHLKNNNEKYQKLKGL